MAEPIDHTTRPEQRPEIPGGIIPPAPKHDPYAAFRSRGFRFQEFMDERGLEEILTEANDGSLSASEIAAAVLWQCCCTNGKFNNFMVGFLSVIQYLNEQEKDIGTQPFHDLASMMKAGTTKDAIEKWMATHFP